MLHAGDYADLALQGNTGQAGFPPEGGLFWRGRRLLLLLLVRGRCFFC
ncbi:hypothetical protein [Quatrionicoccus australiensis]|nr:hypothetical protein [Quatrionicoccus australiensis]UCV14612.1 hypothetical protein KI612_17015 [Quatrionicoccus australiensis]